MESLKLEIQKFKRNLIEQKRLGILAKELRQQRAELEERIKQQMMRCGMDEFAVDVDGKEKRFKLNMKLLPQKKAKAASSSSK